MPSPHPNLRPLRICFLTFLTSWTLFHSETCSSHLDGVLFIPSLGCIFYMPGIAASTPFFCAQKTYILGFCTTIQHSGRLLVIPFAFAGSFLDWEWDRLGFFCFCFVGILAVSSILSNSWCILDGALG